MDEDQVKKLQKDELLKREMERKSHDIYRVVNPTTEAFPFVYGGYRYTIAPKAQHDFERDQAINFVKHLTDKIQGERLAEATVGENKRRVKAGMKPLDKVSEQLPFDTKWLQDNPRDIVEKTILLGLIRKYGGEGDVIAEQMQRPDQRRSEERLFDVVPTLQVDSSNQEIQVPNLVDISDVAEV